VSEDVLPTSEDVLRKLKSEEARREIKSHIEAYRRGGPDRRAEDIVLAEAHGLTGVRELWEEVEATLRRQGFIRAEPRAEAKPKAETEAPKVGASPVKVEEPKPKGIFQKLWEEKQAKLAKVAKLKMHDCRDHAFAAEPIKRPEHYKIELPAARIFE
jgi:hypothetical protein